MFNYLHVLIIIGCWITAKVFIRCLEIACEWKFQVDQHRATSSLKSKLNHKHISLNNILLQVIAVVNLFKKRLIEISATLLLWVLYSALYIRNTFVCESIVGQKLKFQAF